MMMRKKEEEGKEKAKEKNYSTIIFSITNQSYMININRNHWIKTSLLVFFSSSSSSRFCGFACERIVGIFIPSSFALSWLHMYVYILIICHVASEAMRTTNRMSLLPTACHNCHVPVLLEVYRRLRSMIFDWLQLVQRHR